MKTNKTTSSTEKKAGVYPKSNTNIKSAKDLIAKRQKPLSAELLFNSLREGNTTALSRAITMVESSNAEHFKLASSVISKCLPHSGNSVRIGITGVPGVGKSTFIEAIGNQLLQRNKKVAVLAVDPSSSSSKGSILGDKTRMETLVKAENVFIRPTAAGESLGGVARKTRESIILCEAAGFDTIIIETVGVGQSETVVHSMVDFFLLLKLAGAGDELQGIKRGIIEMADLIAINKADGENLKAAKLAKQDFKNALHLYPAKESGWQAKVFLCSALKGKGINEIVNEIEAYIVHTKSNGFFDSNRNNQQEYWLKQTIEERLKSQFYNNEGVKAELDKQLVKIKNQEISAFAAAEYLLSL